MDLTEIRINIDRIDAELLRLLSERTEFALRARRHKPSVNDPDRERQILDHLTSIRPGLLTPEFIATLYDVIFTESKRVQGGTRALVGFQGEHGAWGEIAIQQLDSTMVPIPCLEFGNVFSGVGSGEFDYGVAPIENSIEGSISEVNDLLIETDLRIVGEVVLPIHQNLLVLPGCDYREIKVVYSHPQALAQCRAFLSRNKLQPRPFYDTAGAAKWLSHERPASAAVLASRLAAELYGLDIVKENVEDNAENYTRFVFLSQRPDGEGGTKCTIAFSTQHRAGALFEVLRVFKENSLNLTRIESRPVRRNPGAYAFLLDFLGSESEERVQTALRSIKDKTTTMKVLGFYPEARV